MADMAHHDAVLLATVSASDAFLVRDVITDARAMNDLAAKLRILVEQASEPSAELCVPSRQDDTASILHDAVRREARNEAVEVARVVGLDVQQGQVPSVALAERSLGAWPVQPSCRGGGA